jgi:type IV secretion system protein VirB10
LCLSNGYEGWVESMNKRSNFLLRTIGLGLTLSSSLWATQDLVPIPKATKLPPNLYDYRLPPPPPKVEEVVPEPIKEPIIPPIRYTDPEPGIRAAQAKKLMVQRRINQVGLIANSRNEDSAVTEQESLYGKDPHYRQWDGRTLEDKFTYPVDRKWVLTADRYISGILETEISSSIPGTVILVVDRPVFAAEGWTVIFPQYTKVICEYQSLNKVSDSRLSLKCTRAIRPDGASLLFTEAHGTDPMGRNGLVGDIDYRTVEKYGTAGISALAGAGSTVSSNPIAEQGAVGLSQNLGQVTAKVIDQYIDLAPVITIAAGTRVHIRPQTDVWLRQPVSKGEVEAFLKRQEQQPEQTIRGQMITGQSVNGQIVNTSGIQTGGHHP